MTRPPLADRILARLAVVILLSGLTVITSHAQALPPCPLGFKDFQIMVSGPWQFVVALDNNEKDVNGNPTDRLFVVAPQDPTHIAYLWPGPNASMEYWMSQMENELKTMATWN